MTQRHNSFKEVVAVLLALSVAITIGLHILPIVLIFEGAAQEGSLSSRLLSGMAVLATAVSTSLAIILVTKTYQEMVVESYRRLPEQDRVAPVAPMQQRP